MNGDDPLEQRLRHIPQRQIPVEWRQEILNAATVIPVAARLRNHTPSTLWDQLRAITAALIWPNQRAWAGLGFLWLLIIALQLSFVQSDWPRPQLVKSSTVTSPQFLEALRQQERVLTELAELEQLSPRAISIPKPRSQGMQNQANV